MRRFLIAYSFYLAVAILVTWPLLTVIDTRFIGHPFGDVYEYIRHSWWMKTALQTGQPLFDQPLLAYPDGLNGAWLWGNPLQSFPAWLFAFVMPLPLAFNLTALLRLALNGWAMYFLVRDLTGGKTGPALLAGLIFMLFPTFQGQLAIGHTGLLTLWPIPLYIYALRKLNTSPLNPLSIDGEGTYEKSYQAFLPPLSVSERGTGGEVSIAKQKLSAPSLRWFLTVAGLFVVSLWGSLLLLIYLVGPVSLLMLLLPLLRRDWPGLRRTLGAMILGGLLALIFAGPVIAEELAKPARLRESGEIHYSADLLTPFTPSFYHPLFANLPYTHQILGIDPFERMGYIGFAAGVLALVGAWMQRAARIWLWLAVGAWLLALGPLLKVLETVVTINLGDRESAIVLPWLLFSDLPFISATRTPVRFYFAIALAVAIMAGYGAAWLGDRLKYGHKLMWAALMALVIFEYQSFWPFPTIPGTVPEPIQALAARDDVRAVFDLPWTHLLAQKDGLFLQTGHQEPMIAGHVTRRTPVDPAKLTVLEATLDPALLDREGVDILILHKAWAADPEAMQARMPGEMLYEDDRIAVYEVPAPDAAPQFVALVSDDPAIENRIDSYLFAPETGWVTLSGRLQAGGRTVNLLLNGQRIQAWHGMDDIELNVPLPIAQAGYYTVTLAADPPCPQQIAPTLRCRAVQVDDLALAELTPQLFAPPALFGRGVRLNGYDIDSQTRTVRLSWQFGENLTENDIRFVHVVNSDGTLIAQDDRTLGIQRTGQAWAEQVQFADLPPSLYDVYTGWYTYPDFTRFPVASSVPGALDHWAFLGQMRIEN